jgi:hypothetical protein
LGGADFRDHIEVRRLLLGFRRPWEPSQGDVCQLFVLPARHHDGKGVIFDLVRGHPGGRHPHCHRPRWLLFRVRRARIIHRSHSFSVRLAPAIAANALDDARGQPRDRFLVPLNDFVRIVPRGEAGRSGGNVFLLVVPLYCGVDLIPGVGKILALVLLYEIHNINRFAGEGEFLSYARLVRPKKTSAGKVTGGGGSKIGNAHLKWTFSEAACLLSAKTTRPSVSWPARKSSTARPTTASR